MGSLTLRNIRKSFGSGWIEREGAGGAAKNIGYSIST